MATRNKAKHAEKQPENRNQNRNGNRDTKGALTFGLIYGTFWTQAQKLVQVVVAFVAHATARPHTAEARVSINQLFGIGKRGEWRKEK